MTSFEAAYALWVFTSALGAVQFAAACSGLRGLLLFRDRPRETQIASLALVAASFAWFFASGDRNVPDTGDGIDGVVQARFFALAASAAVAALAAVSSVVNHRWGAGHGWDPDAGPWPPSGLTWLERTTFARALWARAASAVRALRRRR